MKNPLNTILDLLHKAEFKDPLEEERGIRVATIINNAISRKLGWGICSQSHENLLGRCIECKSAV